MCAAASIDDPKITATARRPSDPSIASLDWTSLGADVVDVNVYSGDTFSEVSPSRHHYNYSKCCSLAYMWLRLHGCLNTLKLGNLIRIDFVHACRRT